MRVKINYNGWISTPSQLRYDKLCSEFAKVADLVADDEERTRATMEWIQSQLNAMSISKVKSSCGSRMYSQHNVEEEDPNCGEAATPSSGQIFDPRCSQTKGAPRKLRKKGPLETNTKKTKVCFYLFFTNLKSIFVILKFLIIMIVNLILCLDEILKNKQRQGPKAKHC